MKRGFSLSKPGTDFFEVVTAIHPVKQTLVIFCQRHSQEVPRTGDRSYEMGSIRGWSRLHLTYIPGSC